MPSINLNKTNLKILLIQFKAAGDVLLLTPAVKAIKEKFPGCHISFMANEKESVLVKDFKQIDELILIKKIPKNSIINYYKYLKENLSVIFTVRKSNFDIIIDFIGNPRSALITFLSGTDIRIGRRLRNRSYAYNIKIKITDNDLNTVLKRLKHLEPLGIEANYTSPVINLNHKDKTFAEKYFRSQNIGPRRPIVFLAPNSPRSARKWKAEYFISAGRTLSDKYNCKILLAWGPGEEEYTRKILNGIGGDAVMIPLTSLTEMAAIFSKGKLIITNDSGAKHISNAVGLRSITIYGPTNPHVWNHIDTKKNPAVRADVPCIQCEKRECPNSHHICMDKVTPDIIIKIADSILGNNLL
jgi:ADP-heptose:LPS heptosyltransferase